jgi:serine/threonine protein kinase
VILYALLCAVLPFDEKSLDLLYVKIKAGEFSFPENIILSDDVKDLIRRMLVVDFAERCVYYFYYYIYYFIIFLQNYHSRDSSSPMVQNQYPTLSFVRDGEQAIFA